MEMEKRIEHMLTSIRLSSRSMRLSFPIGTPVVDVAEGIELLNTKYFDAFVVSGDLEDDDIDALILKLVSKGIEFPYLWLTDETTSFNEVDQFCGSLCGPVIRSDAERDLRYEH
jgi:hypothetical protein